MDGWWWTPVEANDPAWGDFVRFGELEEFGTPRALLLRADPTPPGSILAYLGVDPPVLLGRGTTLKDFGSGAETWVLKPMPVSPNATVDEAVSWAYAELGEPERGVSDSGRQMLADLVPAHSPGERGWPWSYAEVLQTGGPLAAEDAAAWWLKCVRDLVGPLTEANTGTGLAFSWNHVDEPPRWGLIARIYSVDRAGAFRYGRGTTRGVTRLANRLRAGELTQIGIELTPTNGAGGASHGGGAHIVMDLDSTVPHSEEPVGSVTFWVAKGMARRAGKEAILVAVRRLADDWISRFGVHAGYGGLDAGISPSAPMFTASPWETDAFGANSYMPVQVRTVTRGVHRTTYLTAEHLGRIDGDLDAVGAIDGITVTALPSPNGDVYRVVIDGDPEIDPDDETVRALEQVLAPVLPFAANDRNWAIIQANGPGKGPAGLRAVEGAEN